MLLLSLPSQLQFQIACKMTTRTMCRFRQSHNAIDRMIEANRFKIGARTDLHDWVLLISVDGANQQTPQFHVLADNILELQDLEFLYFNENLIKIDDPFKQLSGVRFDVILASLLVETDQLTGELKADQLRSSEDTFIKEIIPTVRKMKLDCDWLASSMASPFGELSSEVRFNKCYVWHPTVPTSTFINWNLSHCTQLEISLITDEPECETICKMIGNAGKASFMFSDRVKVLDVFQNFLRNGPFTNTFLKCPVGNGVAVICYDASILIDIYIRDEDKRETLLECLYDHMFCDIPFDPSAVFQQFVEAPTDTLAFDLLRESYPTNF